MADAYAQGVWDAVDAWLYLEVDASDAADVSHVANEFAQDGWSGRDGHGDRRKSWWSS